MRALSFLILGLAVVLSAPACASRAAPGAQGAQVATIVADNPRQRAWDNLAKPDCLTGRVMIRVAACGGGGERFTVPAGRVNLQVVYEDTQDTVENRRLLTRPIEFSFDVQCGRVYRIRGFAFHPPCSPNSRSQDPRDYRVVFAAQDLSTGQVVQKIEVDPSNNTWKNTSPDLLMELIGGS